MGNLPRKVLWDLFVVQLCLLEVILHGDFGFYFAKSMGAYREWAMWILTYLGVLATGLIAALLFREYDLVWIQLGPPLAIRFYEMLDAWLATGRWPGLIPEYLPFLSGMRP